MKQSILILSIWIISLTTIYAQDKTFTVINKSSYPVEFCYGWVSGSGTYGAAGWYKLTPNNSMTFNRNCGTYFIYGEQRSGGKKIYQGVAPERANLFRHKTKAFEIENAHMGYHANEDPGFVNTLDFLRKSKLRNISVYKTSN